MSGEPEPEKLPRWGKREARACERRNRSFDLRQLDMIAQWPEDWTTYHAHGLECVVMSGRVTSTLFTGPSRGIRVQEVFPERDREDPWIHFVAGRLLAGVGVEVLLKDLYLTPNCAARCGGGSGSSCLAGRAASGRSTGPCAA